MSTRHLHTIGLALLAAGCGRGAPGPGPVFPQRKGETIEQVAVRLHHPSFGRGEKRERTLCRRVDRDGLPVEYGMWVDSVFCAGNECDVVDVKLVWDVLGRFSRYELPPGTLLTKNDRVPFAGSDHARLQAILRDRDSILRTRSLESLTRPVKTTTVDADGRGVDAVTHATEMTVRHAVVEGATYTTYNLWHWANGEAVEAIRQRTHRSCGRPLLLRLLRGDRQHEVLFGIEHLGRHAIHDRDAVAAVTAAMRDGDADRMEAGVAYLRAALPDPEAFYGHLGRFFGGSDRRAQIHLLTLLANEKELPDVLYGLLATEIPRLGEYYELHLLLTLLERGGHASRRVLAAAAAVLEHENFFMARRAFWFLQKQELPTDLQEIMKAFRDRHADRL